MTTPLRLSTGGFLGGLLVSPVAIASMGLISFHEIPIPPDPPTPGVVSSWWGSPIRTANVGVTHEFDQARIERDDAEVMQILESIMNMGIL